MTFKRSIIKAPSGRYIFAGSVDCRLALVRQDGKPLTKQDCENATISGPAAAGLKTRSFDSYDAAMDAVKALDTDGEIW